MEVVSQSTKEISVGAIIGYCCGQFTRKMTKEAMYQVGGAFMCLQALSIFGQIDINQTKIEKDTIEVLDQDQDGKLTMNDLNVFMKKYGTMMLKRVPSAGGFAAAYQYGLKNDIL